MGAFFGILWFMATLKNKTLKQLSPWTISVASSVSFVITLSLTIALLFTLFNQSIDKQDYASSFILCFTASTSLFSLAFSTRKRMISAVPAFLGGLLFLISLGLLRDVLSKDYFSYIASSNPVEWVFYSFLISIPVFVIAILELRRKGNNVAWKSIAVINILVPILLLTTVAVPVRNQANSSEIEFEKELTENANRIADSKKREDTLKAEGAVITSELRRTAFKTVQNISGLAAQNKTLPASVPFPEGYTISEYIVQDKYKVKFCMHPSDNPSYNIGGVVDWSAESGTMYWLSDIQGSKKCNYENFNLMDL